MDRGRAGNRGCRCDTNETEVGRSLRIAIQGEPGSFSHEAALRRCRRQPFLPCALSAEVFAAVDEGAADAAVIPIENSLAGSVLEHYDLLLTHEVAVESELLLRIRHNLIGVPGSEHRPDSSGVFASGRAGAMPAIFSSSIRRSRPAPFYDTAGSVKQLVELSDRAWRRSPAPEPRLIMAGKFCRQRSRTIRRTTHAFF